MTAPLPLAGVRVLDFSTLAAPWVSYLLAAYGADVIAVEGPDAPIHDTLREIGFGRGKRSLMLDLRAPGGRQLALDLIAKADVVVEAMRPGKMEALGLGPADIQAAAPGCIYVRFSNFGQIGPLSQLGGHDINAIALGGALSLVGLDQPLPPASLLGDWASAGLPAVIGVLLALLARARDGKGRVVDAAMSDGAAMLAGPALEMMKRGQWGKRGANLLDGSRPYYTTYRCADGKWLALGAIEPKFFAAFIERAGLAGKVPAAEQYAWDKDQCAHYQAVIAQRLMDLPREEWLRLFDGIDACLSPVLELDELSGHPLHKTRGSVVETDEGPRAAIAPRVSGFEWPAGFMLGRRGADTAAILAEFGIAQDRIEGAAAAGAIRL